MNITEMLDALKQTREAATHAREIRRQIIEEAQASVEYKQADETLTAADTLITKLESDIRSAALTAYDNGEDLPDRVDIKWFTVIKITDPLKAKEWALHNFTPALTLDTKAFEKAAKDGGIPAELVTISKEARAQIATKL